MLAAARQRRRSNHRRDYNNALPIDVKMQPSLVVVSGRRRAQTQLRTTILYCTVLYCTVPAVDCTYSIITPPA
jgi:hypothetical protein